MAEPSGALQGHFVSRGPLRAGSQVALATRLDKREQTLRKKSHRCFCDGSTATNEITDVSHFYFLMYVYY